MRHVLGYRCMLCGAEYGLDEIDYICPLHGDDGIVDVRYDYDLLRSTVERGASGGEMGMWRYKALLPVDLRKSDTLPPLRVGGTPLYAAPRLAEALHKQTGRWVRDVWIKDDGLNPTASFKDRASALAVVKAQELGATTVTTASTGNAAAALAGLAASVGLRAVIFVPRTAPAAKIAQHLVYGAQVFLVDGSYDDAFDLTLEVARAFGWYNRNTAYNPFMTEGKKTCAYEICEQLGWQAPDTIFVPVGDGCIIGGIHKGLKDLLALGWIDRMPRLIGIQAEGSAALVDAFDRGLDSRQMVPQDANTVADSICARLPRDRAKALSAVRETGGHFLAVPDAKILRAEVTIARMTGVFCEPAAAASYAGLVRAVELGLVATEERVVLLLTGSGLKDIPSVMRAVPEPLAISASLDAVRSALQRDVS